MNRVEFLQELEKGLARVSPDERVAALQYYTEYFDDAGPAEEEQVILQLGSPSQVAADIMASWGLAETEPAPAESGLVAAAQSEAAGEEAAEGSEGAGASSQLDGRPVPALQLQELPGGGAGSPHGPPPPVAYRSPPPFRSGETVPLPPPPASLQRVTQAAQQAAATASEAVQQVAGNLPVRAILLILAAILLAPVILGLGGGLIGVATGALVVLCVLPVVGIAVVAAGGAVAGVGISILGAATSSGLLMLGLGLLTMAIGLFFTYGGAKLIGWAIPAAVRGIKWLFNKIKSVIQGV